MPTEDSIPDEVERVHEDHAGGIPALVHRGWLAAMPWLVQGTTTRGSGAVPCDLGVHAEASPRQRVLERWDRLVVATGMTRAVHSHQVHGAEVRVHDGSAAVPGRTPDGDGHATAEAGVLLAVTVADCVPVFVVSEETEAVAVLHAGWRGVAAGVLERGLAVVTDDFGIPPSELLVHFGPSICGRCYEVGPEVFAALSEPVPEGPTPIDLRRVLLWRAMAAGVPPRRISVSTHCTLCTGSGLFSHRGGDEGRQVGFVGIRR